MSIKEELLMLAEEEYSRFAAGLLPNIDSSLVLGVRLPRLRKLAAKVCKGDWRGYLENEVGHTFEEHMLRGFVIGLAPVELSERFSLIKDFLPLIDNWSVCDSFCSSLKSAREHPEEFWQFLRTLGGSGKEYEARFFVVMLLFYYVDESHIHQVLLALDRESQMDYYARMAVAWGISICYVRFPEITLDYLKQCRLDDFTYNKALQKIRESHAVAREDKDMIKTMKRGQEPWR